MSDTSPAPCWSPVVAFPYYYMPMKRIRRLMGIFVVIYLIRSSSPSKRAVVVESGTRSLVVKN